MTSSWFFLSTLNYDARSTTHQILKLQSLMSKSLQGHKSCVSRIMRRRNQHHTSTFDTLECRRKENAFRLTYTSEISHKVAHLVYVIRIPAA